MMNEQYNNEFDAIIHAQPQLQYTILVLAGQEYAYAYNALTDQVHTAEFPDTPIHKLYTACGHVLHHDDIRTMVKAKLGILSHCELTASFS
jgi:fructose 1,6-bisphosphatase